MDDNDDGERETGTGRERVGDEEVKEHKEHEQDEEDEEVEETEEAKNG